jgi:UDP-glucose 4-epimerase
VRDYIHVSDLVDAHALLLDHLRAGGPSLTLNCGYGQGYSVRQVIDRTRALSGASFEVRETGRRPGDAPAVVARADRIRRTLGWRPKHADLDAIVSSALAWEQHLALKAILDARGIAAGSAMTSEETAPADRRRVN